MIVIDSRSVRATWDNPIDPNGIILSFSLALQLAPGQDYLPPPTETAITLDPSTFERVIQGLHPFARYDFTLRAATSFGEGNITNSFAITNEAGTCVDTYTHASSVHICSFKLYLPWCLSLVSADMLLVNVHKL